VTSKLSRSIPDGRLAKRLVLQRRRDRERVRFIVDAQPTSELGPPFRLAWRLTPGRHQLQVETTGARSGVVSFEVAASLALDAQAGARFGVGLGHAEDR